ncbi:sirohydrochlorin chelatase [Arthrobacter sp. G.S.26]|uniref:sirohydrochlorin chelatase n=1 Tax=Arthrobacter sp. G.S.26 TaxID=3433706 RepID=UPI003D77EE77
MNSPIMIACAHGTSSDIGGAEVNGLRAGISALRPGLDVRESYVDVQDPDLVDVMAGLPEGEAAVVVPLLLSVGYHTKVDIARAVGSRANSLASAPLGPDPRLAEVLDQRLREAGITADDAVVLAAAGSSNPDAAVSVQEVAAHLRKLRGNRIVPAYGAAEKPSVPDAVAALRAEYPGGEGKGRVIIASYLLAHGFFHDQLAKAGADVVAEPLLPSDVLAQVALDRYDHAVAGHTAPQAGAPSDTAPQPEAPPETAPRAAAPAAAPASAAAETEAAEAPAGPAQKRSLPGIVKRFVTKYFPR